MKKQKNEQNRHCQQKKKQDRRMGICRAVRTCGVAFAGTDNTGGITE